MKSINSLKLKYERYLKHLIVDKNQLQKESQFFHLICLIGICFFLFFIAVNAIFEVDIKLSLVKLGVIVIFGILYYLSRYKGLFKQSSFMFFIVLLGAFLYLGIQNAGVFGGIAPLYAGILALILFLTSRPYKSVLLVLWFGSVSVLFVIEYYFPDFIVPYASKIQQYTDMYISYLSGTFLISFVVVIVKRLYHIQSNSVLGLLENIKMNQQLLKQLTNNQMKYLTENELYVYHLMLDGKSKTEIADELFKPLDYIDETIEKVLVKINQKKDFHEKILQLSRCEKRVLNLVLEDKTNKEIGNELYVSLGTVKSHINKIYKKLDVKNRHDILRQKKLIREKVEELEVL